MAYAMTYALPEDMRLIRQYVSDNDFIEALDHAPPGIIDPRSWAYWNSKMGRYPPPPHPVRRFESTAHQSNPAAVVPGPQTKNAPAERRDLEAQRRYGAKAWRQMKDGAPKTDLEEVRRHAAQRWRAKYG